MKSASSKVLFRPNSVLNQTPTSVSLITTISIVIKISTAILRFMAPANYSGTFPGIIRESWEVQVNLVSKTLRIRLRRAELTVIFFHIFLFKVVLPNPPISGRCRCYTSVTPDSVKGSLRNDHGPGLACFRHSGGQS